MKRKGFVLSAVLLVLVLTATCFYGCGTAKTKNGTTLTKVKLNEVTRSAFYAPFYVAMNEGYFKEQGLAIDLSIGEGADKTMQQVISKNADIGFCGPEQTIYINNKNKEDYPILFAQLTQTDGAFLVSRKPVSNFTWQDLQGKKVIGGRPGGVPEMSFEYVLKKNGLQNGKNITLVTNVDFSATAGAFKGGIGDFVTLFEPTASMLEKDKSGYIVASVGKSAGVIPYTCYFTTKSYMDKHSDIIQKFTKAIYEGQQWVDKHSDTEVANEIKSFFVGTDVGILEKVVKNYRGIDAYAHTPILTEDSLNRLMDIIQSYDPKLIPTRPAYSKIVNSSIANKVVNGK